MQKLSLMRLLQIDIKHLLIYSARYGIRRECSHILIHPPAGCKVQIAEGGGYQPSAKFISLDELTDDLNVMSFADTGQKKKGKKIEQKGILRDFFVGGVDLKKSETFNLELSDIVLRQWIAGISSSSSSSSSYIGGGCIRIELCSYMYSPDGHSSRGYKTSEPVVYASVDVPLGGVLNTDAMDVAVTCELNADMSNLTNVVTRMQAMPFGHQLVRAKPLGPKMGSISCRITLKPDATTAIDVFGLRDKTDDDFVVDDDNFNPNRYGLPKKSKKASAQASTSAYTDTGQNENAEQLLMVEIANNDVTSARAAEVVDVPDMVEDALNYCPVEAPKEKQIPSVVSLINSQKTQNTQNINSKLMGSTTRAAAASKSDVVGVSEEWKEGEKSNNNNNYNNTPTYLGVTIYSMQSIDLNGKRI